MKLKYLNLWSLFLLMIFVSPMKGWSFDSLLASSETSSTESSLSDFEEISYDELLNRIHLKKTQVVEESRIHPLDVIYIHAGLGLNSSLIFIENQTDGIMTPKLFNGFQISVGIDLLNPQWSSEFALRNFGQSRIGNEIYSLREWNLKVHYRTRPEGPRSLRWGGGFGTRQWKFIKTVENTSLSELTPMMIMIGGYDFYIKNNFSSGVEMSYRTALVARTQERSAIDLMLRMDTYF